MDRDIDSLSSRQLGAPDENEDGRRDDADRLGAAAATVLERMRKVTRELELDVVAPLLKVHHKTKAEALARQAQAALGCGLLAPGERALATARVLLDEAGVHANRAESVASPD